MLGSLSVDHTREHVRPNPQKYCNDRERFQKIARTESTPILKCIRDTQLVYRCSANALYNINPIGGEYRTSSFN